MHLAGVYRHLRERGELQVEGVALWTGHVKDNSFIVDHTIIPAQTGHRTEDGLLYTVSGEELHRINEWLFSNQQTLFIQIHSHPTGAYHSEMDDRFPIVTINGGISIVIPDFGFNKVSISEWAVYRLWPGGEWRALDKKGILAMLEIL